MPGAVHLRVLEGEDRSLALDIRAVEPMRPVLDDECRGPAMAARRRDAERVLFEQGIGRAQIARCEREIHVNAIDVEPPHRDARRDTGVRDRDTRERRHEDSPHRLGDGPQHQIQGGPGGAGRDDIKFEEAT